MVDATFEHLTVLRVLIEGLAGNQEAGLWLTDVRGIPVVPRISPLDLVYLDAQNHVVLAVELLPTAEQPPFRAPAVSALVLPFQTISSTQTYVGDQLSIVENMTGVPDVEAGVVKASVKSVENAPVAWPMATPVERAPELKKTEAAEPVFPVPAAAPMGGRSKTESVAHLRSKKNKAYPRLRKSKRVMAAKPKKEEVAVVRSPHEAALASEVKQPVASPAQALNKINQKAESVSLAKGGRWRTLVAKVRSAVNTVIKAMADALKADESNPKSVVDRALHWLNPNAYRKEQRSSIRRPTEALVAYGGPEGRQHEFVVADISSSGMYLRTEEKWKPGTPVSLTLQHSGPQDEREDRRMEVQANTVRAGSDGVGLAFSFPESMHLDLWETAAKGAVAETGPEYIVHEMRMARAVGAIRSICPEVVDEVDHVLRKDFSNMRVASAIRIILMAEELLARQEKGSVLRAPASLVMHILDLGSWADMGSVQMMWAGLLATACTIDGKDEPNAELAELLGQLTPLHLRVLCMVCDRALESAPDDGTGRLVVQGCSARELMRDLNLANFLKTVRTIGELDGLGLVAAAKRSPSDPPDTDTRVVATPLGLRLVARCHGWRGEIVIAQPQSKVSAIS